MLDVAGISVPSEQSSLTVADAKAFREWCENQITKLTSRGGNTCILMAISSFLFFFMFDNDLLL